MSLSVRAGEQVRLIDTKKRRYLRTLTEGKEFHSHSGIVTHDAVIGSPEGTTFRSSHGMYYTAIRPTLSDFIFKMPRGAQVIYPKDLGAILMHADIFPGARILESGVGSRSEENTSELQSLMRISYAVFCLKKKKNRHKNNKT